MVRCAGPASEAQKEKSAGIARFPAVVEQLVDERHKALYVLRLGLADDEKLPRRQAQGP